MRAAVIGVGAIGRHHARVFNELDGVELAAVADADETRRTAAARKFRIPVYASPEELFAAEQIDLVSIAVPTGSHHAVALAAIERGLHLLVEEPFASTVAEAEEIIQRADERGVVLTVGHIERFNPAVTELKRRLTSSELGRVFQLHAHRLSPFPAYVRDVGVVMDLATHELDIMRWLAASEVERVFAETRRNVHPDHEDLLSGILRFANGVVGVLDINWLTPTKVRELRVTGERGMFLVDYLKQDLYFFENSQAPAQWEAMALFRGVAEGYMLKLRVNKVEPLEAELRSFADAAANGTAPVVSGLDGLRALALAQLLIASAEQGNVLQVTEEAERRGWPELRATAPER